MIFQHFLIVTQFCRVISKCQTDYSLTNGILHSHTTKQVLCILLMQLQTCQLRLVELQALWLYVHRQEKTTTTFNQSYQKFNSQNIQLVDADSTKVWGKINYNNFIVYFYFILPGVIIFIIHRLPKKFNQQLVWCQISENDANIIIVEYLYPYRTALTRLFEFKFLLASSNSLQPIEAAGSNPELGQEMEGLAVQ
ncbi:hypothetical protein SS50377_21437 [Spironucleus salmonicida]|uniref:Transmembrane protein n=1 Tax=Spironucleus salmonicida TaxID=348837 RepID=V6LFF8_9EUKA|nr:hypothetical protein SS50377_21437 [Spironucleus salmonicida]|eukprot:EST42441.1 Hypothetical protein SS50377_18004 [Spironucleus salmonicida]